MDMMLSAELHKELPNKRVLIVDRYPVARDTLRNMLSSLGISSVSGAGSAHDALRQVRSSSFDILFSDYVLDEGRDGQQLLEELRLNQLIPLSTVFIVISSESSYQNVVSVAELAPDDYLIKPFTADQLQARLFKALFKKNFFAPIYRRIDAGSYHGALNACQRLLATDSPFELDLLRVKGEILNAIGRHEEAEAVYREILGRRSVPWARMGLAIALRGNRLLQEAGALAEEVVKDFPEYLSAYDFLASVQEDLGQLDSAQAVLQKAALISPKNAQRQRIVGDVAMRNGDTETAEKAYSVVLERLRGTAMIQVDDFANLSRTLLEKGKTPAARLLINELKRDWRGNALGTFAASVMDSLCLHAEGETEKAREAMADALQRHTQLKSDGSRLLSHTLIVDLAQACLTHGAAEDAEKILRQIAAENNDNPRVLADIESVFTRTGHAESGRALLDQVGNEIGDLQQRSMTAVRADDLEASVRLFSEAADRAPNIQMLINATKAICALMDRQGWNDELAERARNYITQAMAKSPRDARVLAGREMFQRVSAKYGVAK